MTNRQTGCLRILGRRIFWKSNPFATDCWNQDIARVSAMPEEVLSTLAEALARATDESMFRASAMAADLRSLNRL